MDVTHVFSENPELIWNVELYCSKTGDRSRLGSFLWCSPILLVSSQKGPQAISEALRAGEGQFSPSVFCPSSSIIHEIATRARQKNFLWLICKDILKCDSHAKFHQNWTSILGNTDMAWFGPINKFNMRQFLCLPLFPEGGHLGGNDLGDQSILSIPSD